MPTKIYENGRIFPPSDIFLIKRNTANAKLNSNHYGSAQHLVFAEEDVVSSITHSDMHTYTAVPDGESVSMQITIFVE